MQGRGCCVHGHHHDMQLVVLSRNNYDLKGIKNGSRNRGNSLWATVATSWRQFSVRTLVFSLCFTLIVGNSTILPFGLFNSYCCFAFINSYPSYIHIPHTRNHRRTRFLLEQRTAFAVAKSNCK